jgi:tetratricopeptide (TPR) repeat protein
VNGSPYRRRDPDRDGRGGAGGRRGGAGSDAFGRRSRGGRDEAWVDRDSGRGQPGRGRASAGGGRGSGDREDRNVDDRARTADRDRRDPRTGERDGPRPGERPRFDDRERQRYAGDRDRSPRGDRERPRSGDRERPWHGDRDGGDFRRGERGGEARRDRPGERDRQPRPDRGERPRRWDRPGPPPGGREGRGGTRHDDRGRGEGERRTGAETGYPPGRDRRRPGWGEPGERYPRGADGRGERPQGGRSRYDAGDRSQDSRRGSPADRDGPRRDRLPRDGDRGGRREDGREFRGGGYRRDFDGRRQAPGGDRDSRPERQGGYADRGRPPPGDRPPRYDDRGRPGYRDRDRPGYRDAGRDQAARYADRDRPGYADRRRSTYGDRQGSPVDRRDSGSGRRDQPDTRRPSDGRDRAGAAKTGSDYDRRQPGWSRRGAGSPRPGTADRPGASGTADRPGAGHTRRDHDERRQWERPQDRRRADEPRTGAAALGAPVTEPPDVDARSLDPVVRAELRSLARPVADLVARRLVAAGQLLDDEPATALAHALEARRLAPRIASVREAAGLTAYHAGEWSTAIAELRAYHRMTGNQTHLAVLADCERALGRPERAIDIYRSVDRTRLNEADAVELLIVAAGARADMGQRDASVAMLQVRELGADQAPWVARLRYAFADALLTVGRRDEAREWFARAAEADEDLTTDAAERLLDLDGVVLDTADDETDEFGEADLGEADLGEADLGGADLSEAAGRAEDLVEDADFAGPTGMDEEIESQEHLEVADAATASPVGESELADTQAQPEPVSRAEPAAVAEPAADVNAAANGDGDAGFATGSGDGRSHPEAATHQHPDKRRFGRSADMDTDDRGQRPGDQR